MRGIQTRAALPLAFKTIFPYFTVVKNWMEPVAMVISEQTNHAENQSVTSELKDERKLKKKQHR